MKREAISIKPLHFLSIQLADKAEPAEVTRRRDVSPEFHAELMKRFRKGNLINIQVRGEQTSGKSTVGLAIAKFVQEVLLQKKFTIWNITHDQLDFIERVKDSDIENECMLIDEWNELATTGYNATTHQALLTSFIEIQAQRGIHRIGCSPQKVIDHTAPIILDVIDRDEKKKYTRCFCYYVIHPQGTRFEQFLGYVDIDVSPALKDKTYPVYRKKKFSRFTMLLDHKITDARKAGESKIIVDVVERLAKMARECLMVSRDNIKNYIQIVQSQYTALSIYGQEDMIGRIYGILSLIKQAEIMRQKIERAKRDIRKSPDSGYAVQLGARVEILSEAREDLLKQFEESMQEHYKIIDIQNKFDSEGLK